MKKLTGRQWLAIVGTAAAGMLILAARLGAGAGPSYTPEQPALPAATASPNPTSSPGVSPSPTAAAKPRDDGVAPKPSTPPAAGRQQKVQDTATEFASVWLTGRVRTPQPWYEDLLPHLTGDMAEQLNGVDPRRTVPAGRVIDSKVTVEPLGDNLWNADVPIFTDATKRGQLVGTLHLTLLADGDQWLVSNIDWERK